jgi:hypothetical protein
VSYTALLFNGYDFAVQSQFQLNAGTNGKTTNLPGFVQAVPGGFQYAGGRAADGAPQACASCLESASSIGFRLSGAARSKK